ncbi:MAG: DMT family transporter, partial [Oscillospiraceae bacterium]
MKKSYIKYIAALFLFGSNGIIASHISLTSYEIVLSRSFIGSIFLIAIYAFGKNKPRFLKDKRTVVYLIVSGIAMGANWLFLYEAYRQIGVSISTLACYCGPVILMVLAPAVFKEKLTPPKVIGIASVFAGMFFVYGAELMKRGFSWGLVFGLLSAVMYPVMV